MITPDLARTVLLGYLVKFCLGEGAARTQGRIASDLRGLGLDVDARAVRDMMGELVDEGYPVGTTSAKPPGAFVCVGRRDFRRGYRNLYSRVRAQAKRCQKFKAMAREILSGQRRFDFLEARAFFADLEAAPLLTPGRVPTPVTTTVVTEPKAPLLASGRMPVPAGVRRQTMGEARP